MISFRYHIVSIVAVFVALALGIVVGTTALNGPITTDLRKQVNSLKSDRTTLAQQVKGLQGQVDDAGSFASTYGANLVASTLTKQKVLIIGLPGVNTTIEDQVSSLLRAAGATVTGRIELSSDYVDQGRAGDIDSLITSQQLTGQTLPQTSDAGKLAAAMLSYVLLGKGQSTDLTQVIAAFQNLGVLTAPSTPTPATNVVVVGSDSVPANSYQAGVELDLVAALQAAGAHEVVAGDSGSAKDGGIVAQVRDGALKSVISTVDNADTSIGLVSTVLALNDVRSGDFGHYGTGAGATHLFPPSPSR